MVVRLSSSPDPSSPLPPSHQPPPPPEAPLPYPVSPTSPHTAAMRTGSQNQTLPDDGHTPETSRALNNGQDAGGQGEPLPSTLRAGNRTPEEREAASRVPVISGNVDTGDHEPIRAPPSLPASLRVASPAGTPRTSQEHERPRSLQIRSPAATPRTSQEYVRPAVPEPQAPVPPSSAAAETARPPNVPGRAADATDAPVLSATLNHPMVDDPDIEDDVTAWRQKRASLIAPPRKPVPVYSNNDASSGGASSSAAGGAASAPLETSRGADSTLGHKEEAPSFDELGKTSGPPPDWYTKAQTPQTPVRNNSETRVVGTPGSVHSDTTQRTTGSGVWDPGADISTFDAFSSRTHGLPDVGEEDEGHVPRRSWQEQQDWEQSERQRKAEELATAMERAQIAERERAAEEEFHRGEHQQARSTNEIQHGPINPNQETGVVRGPGPPPSSQPAEAAPSASEPTTSAPPPVDTTAGGKKKQTSETYQIKHVNWVDASSPTPRTSPILVQNANGPCPLLALVNALTLSTPRGGETALTETLRLREHVSLGLLLDAVFDELMSVRRGDAAQILPDVSDLYAFLVTLHTGMNVNPRFVPADAPAPGTGEDGSNAPEVEGSVGRSTAAAFGTFEETREMRLYSTFCVPLIHGWLPPTDDPAYLSLQRSARTYEDAQNLLFRDEELRDKLQHKGLEPQELSLLQDVEHTKSFLEQSATQLTRYGLQKMIDGLAPGSIAILFRNDHFSTLYKHPQSHNLLQLVTDMGYAGHQEVVWESLVDVTGERSDFFAGDFRPVGVTTETGGAEEGVDGWETYEGARRSSRRRKPVAGQPTSSHPISPGHASSGGAAGSNQGTSSASATEQEDHDLALALQLQEEEEDRHHREMAARRHEDALSQTYLSSDSAGANPSPGAAGNNNNLNAGQIRVTNSRRSQQQTNSLVPPRGAQSAPTGNAPLTNRPAAAGGDPPPPSYEHAATTTPYYPPAGDPAFAGNPAPVPHLVQRASTGGVPPVVTSPRPPAPGGFRPQAGVAYNPQQVGYGQQQANMGPPRRRQSAGPGGQQSQNKDCVVM